MPASETQQGQRGGARLLTVVFWIGVGLAPLAAVLVMVSSGATGLRIAAVLAILAVVLIGLSIRLRPDASRVRAEVEDLVFEELDVLREDIREDISTAVKATHRAFSEKLQQVLENVEMLRDQVEGAQAEGYQPAVAKTTVAPAPTGRAAPSPPVGTAMVGGGVVRHTETVKVTTRHTVVDPHGDRDRGTVYGGAGTVYGGAQPAEQPVSPPVGRRSAERAESRHAQRASDEESWTEQRLRERMTEARDSTRDAMGRDSTSRDAAAPRSRSFDRDSFDRGSFDRDDRSDDAGDDPRWSGMRAGDRWTSVRTDDRGRELRMGERRAAVHSDESGTELHIEDRWAQVRQEDARHRGERWEPDSVSFSDDSGSWSEASWEQRGGAPALPASGPEPASSWTQSWQDDRERDREPVRRRRGEDRDDRWEHDDTTSRSATRSRRTEFELNDERWR
jgi:hypothetical protein